MRLQNNILKIVRFGYAEAYLTDSQSITKNTITFEFR